MKIGQSKWIKLFFLTSVLIIFAFVLFFPFHYDIVDHIRPAIVTPLGPNQVAITTYYAIQKNANHSVHYDKSYFSFLKISLTNIAAYAHDKGHPFFFRNQNLVDTEKKAAYWGKMDTVEKYLDFGYEWVIWTDVDVLFMKNHSLLDRFIQPAHDSNKHVALVLECDSPEKFGSVRSGFFAVRNSLIGRKFLDEWRNSFEKYHTAWNPDQEALENMMKQDYWKSVSKIMPPDGIHTYIGCYERYDSECISLHFPGPYKDRIADWVRKSHYFNDSDFIIDHPMLSNQKTG